MDRSISIMRQRIDKLGVSEPEIRKQSANQIVIELAGVHDPATALRLIGKTAQLELYDFEADLLPPSIDSQGLPSASPSLYDLLGSAQAKAKNGKPTQWYLFKGTKPFAGPKPTKQGLYETTRAKEAKIEPGAKLPKGYKIFAVPHDSVVISCAAATGCPGVRTTGAPSLTYYYLLKYQPTSKKKPIPEMKGDMLKLSGTRADFNQLNQPVVTLEFTGKGAKQFEKITKAEAQRGQLRYNLSGGQGDPLNYSQHFAIVLDRELRSAPYIDFKRNPDGIAGTQAEIEMGQGGTLSDAKQLALVLQTGALPVNFAQQSTTEVSATLGKDSLKEAKKAAIGGLIVVALFLLVLYRFLGLVAVIGLAIYVAFLYAAVLLFNVTMTLPGFAGLILTIGVAADANVVVFERIKEEVRAGKTVRAAISAGYSKGFHTILDANVVTCITALILFAVATAGVKGFALMLLIGTIVSLITAVAATRAMLGLLAGFRWFQNPRFMGAKS
jgi:SecD/SecF fusion protein